jgi:glycosyltransferase involved in cell wall biosynthesis
MRLLFAHPTVLARGNNLGAIKAHKALVAGLAAAGHECEVVTASVNAVPDAADWRALCSLQGAKGPIRFTQTTTVAAGSPGWESRFPKRSDLELAMLIRRRIVDWTPDWVICETGAIDLRLAWLLAGRRLVLSVATPAALPFGPRRATRPWLGWSGVYRRVRRVFCASRFVRDYLHEHGGIDAAVQPPLAYGAGPFVRCAQYDGGVVTMVNPTPHKGASIFACLARRFPEQRFRAITSYARVAPGLAALPNVELVPPSDDLDRVLSGTSVLVVPSMWGEGWGMVCIDAMLRGIPVLASDDGGLPEATLGVGKCIPITPGRLRRAWSGEIHFVERELHPEPWHHALASLLGDRQRWEERSAASTAAARAHITGLSVNPLCDYLSR